MEWEEYKKYQELAQQMNDLERAKEGLSEILELESIDRVVLNVHYTENGMKENFQWVPEICKEGIIAIYKEYVDQKLIEIRTKFTEGDV